jgi:hypothetical protein
MGASPGGAGEAGEGPAVEEFPWDSPAILGISTPMLMLNIEDGSP